MGWASRANPVAQDAKAKRIGPKPRRESDAAKHDLRVLAANPLAAILAMRELFSMGQKPRRVVKG